MKKERQKRKEPKKAPKQNRPTEAEQAKRFLQPLGWMNRILDALIEILESHLVAGERLSPGTIDLIDLLIEYKKRAIREGFADYFPENPVKFITYYEYLERMNRELILAKIVAADKRHCKAHLGRAENAKRQIIRLFPEMLETPFTIWFTDFFDVDQALDRMDAAIILGRVRQLEFERMIRALLGRLRLLKLTIQEAINDGAGSDAEGMLSDIEGMMARAQVLLESIQRQDIKLDNIEDRRRIRRILGRIRGGKYNALRELGLYAGIPVLDWYKRLFEIDYYMENAADSWAGGQIVPWNPDQVKSSIESAERAKARFIKLFPDFLGKSLYWYYNHLFHMDFHLDLAKDLLQIGQGLDALQELRKVRRHKHAIEAALRG